MRVAPAITPTTPFGAPRDQRVGEATEVVLDARDHLRFGPELAFGPAQRGVSVAASEEEVERHEEEGPPEREPEEDVRRNERLDEQHPRGVVLIAKSVHGASVRSVGQIALATCAEAKASAIGTRKRVRRTRLESRCGCWIARLHGRHPLTPPLGRGLRPAVPCATRMTAVDADRLLELADTDPEAMFALFEQHGWGDGLPLVPPTRERVDAMLEYGEGDPDEQLAVLPPRSGVVTRRIVAVNAVLAGCPAGRVSRWS